MAWGGSVVEREERVVEVAWGVEQVVWAEAEALVVVTAKELVAEVAVLGLGLVWAEAWVADHHLV